MGDGRTWIATFWSVGNFRTKKSLGCVTVIAHTSKLAREKAEAAKPAGTEKITVATPARFGPSQERRKGFADALRHADVGEIFWRTGDGANERDAASHCGIKIESTVFYAVNANNLREGPDNSACERVRVTRIRVMGKFNSDKEPR